jgi:arylsulfatase A-like enzyme
MSDATKDETAGPQSDFDTNRRNVLLSGVSLLALSVVSDDIGWFHIGAYHQGIMAGRTPNLDRLAAEGMRFTDYYAEASCTAGRANFITGELPIRTGLTTVGQAGSPIGIPAQAVTIATALKSMGYATGQFGKNHLGDLNEFLPTVHGFDEFFGYLYHLDAMEDPAHPNYPQDLLATVGSAQHAPHLGDGHRRSDRAAALGQDRQTENRGCGNALPGTDEDR